jgi:hypothetical protein
VISRLVSERWRDEYGRLWLVLNLINKAIFPKDFSALDAFRRSHHSSLFVVAHALNLPFAYLGLARASSLRILQIDGASWEKCVQIHHHAFHVFRDAIMGMWSRPSIVLNATSIESSLGFT